MFILEKLGKRGQVTTFIIVGIVIVVMVMLLSYFSNDIFRAKVENIFYGASVVPEQVKPVKLYVEECVNDIVGRGIELMELQGGYIEVPENFDVRNDIFSNSLRVFPGEDYRVAYWLYEDRNKRIRDGRLSVREMEDNLGRYVQENLEGCVGNFEDFDMAVVKPNKMEVDVEIRDENINVKLIYPLNIMYKDRRYKINNFFSDYRTDFRRLYEIANEIFEKENEDLFLEELSLEMIYLYKEDIPYSDFVLDCAPKIWRKSEIIEKLKGIINVNVPLINVRKTNFVEYDERFVWDVTREEYDDVFVNVDYSSEWPIEVKIFPHNGEVIQAIPLSKHVKFIDFCMNYMNFIYDITYPVEFIISNSEGESFHFAMHIIIKSNAARESVADFLIDEDSVGYCDFKSNEVGVSVEDTSNGDVLDKARISFNCVNQGCYMGETDENGEFVGNFPVCYNGGLIVNKEGYKDKIERLTTFRRANEFSSSVSVLLEPFVRRKVKVMVYDDLDGEARELKADEKAFIELVNYNDEGKIVYSTFVISGETSEIGLTAERYYVSGNLYKEGEIRIREKKIKQCRCPEVLSVCWCGKKEFKIPATSLEIANIGNMKAEWDVGRDELNNAEEIIFYLYSWGVPTTYDELMEREKEEILPELR